jgi:predicted lipid-binding transport protein (Tim44 family)
VPFDILIFAVIAAFLVYRLYSVLGTRHGDEGARPNPFLAGSAPPRALPVASRPAVLPARAKRPPTPDELGHMIDPASNKDGRVETGLAEIIQADPGFDAAEFLQGARHAFEMIVTAYNKGDLGALQALVSPKLHADFTAGVKARAAAGRTAETIIHRIKSSLITEAHLGGVMAYITVDFIVEETAFARDAAGVVVDGSAERVIEIEDVWTFTRDIRAADPNWTLIETKAAEK